MSQQEEQTTLLHAVWYFVSNPFVIIFGSMFGVMVYGAMVDSVAIALCSFFIPIVALVGYMIEDFAS